MSKNYVSISDVKAEPVGRISLGDSELDWLYGYSVSGTKDIPLKFWGVPAGKLSIWVAEGGVGKSRLAYTLARKRVLQGQTVLFFQAEVDLPTFANWVGEGDFKTFYCSAEKDLHKQAEIIKKLKPSLVFVDSINMINSFKTGRDENVKEIVDVYRDAIAGTRSHVIYLCQVTKTGSAKGSTALTHMPDTTLFLTRHGDKQFKVAIGDKHRYGVTGSSYFGIWEHNDDGVSCISQNRMYDDRYAGSNVWQRPQEPTPPALDRFSYTKVAPHKKPSPTLYKGMPVSLNNCEPIVRQAFFEANPNHPDAPKGFFGKIAKKLAKY
jgi:predicted ATP-dependent serine protease